MYEHVSALTMAETSWSALQLLSSGDEEEDGECGHLPLVERGMTSPDDGKGPVTAVSSAHSEVSTLTN